MKSDSKTKEKAKSVRKLVSLRSRAERWAEKAEIEIGGGTPETQKLICDLVMAVSVTAWIAGYRSCKREWEACIRKEG